jgi:hypothetical protein
MRHQHTDLAAQIALDRSTNRQSIIFTVILLLTSDGRLLFEQVLRHFHIDRRQWIVQQIDIRIAIQGSRHIHSRLLTLKRRILLASSIIRRR